MNPLPLLDQGARAVQSGRVGEATLEAMFSARGVKVVDDNPCYHHAGADLWARSDLLLVRQFRHKRQVFDFMFKDFSRNIDLPIECKQQMGSGTTDQKLAYTVDVLAGCGFPCFWLVLSGGGFHPDLTKAIDKKIKNLSGVKGRLLFNEGSFLHRAIERLIEQGQT